MPGFSRPNRISFRIKARPPGTQEAGDSPHAHPDPGGWGGGAGTTVAWVSKSGVKRKDFGLGGGGSGGGGARGDRASKGASGGGKGNRPGLRSRKHLAGSRWPCKSTESSPSPPHQRTVLRRIRLAFAFTAALLGDSGDCGGTQRAPPPANGPRAQECAAFTARGDRDERPLAGRRAGGPRARENEMDRK